MLALDYSTWNYLTVCKPMNTDLFKMLSSNYSFTNHIYLVYMYEQDLALNNLERLIYRKTQPTNNLCTAKSAQFLKQIFTPLLVNELLAWSVLLHCACQLLFTEIFITAEKDQLPWWKSVDSWLQYCVL